MHLNVTLCFVLFPFNFDIFKIRRGNCGNLAQRYLLHENHEKFSISNFGGPT